MDKVKIVVAVPAGDRKEHTVKLPAARGKVIEVLEKLHGVGELCDADGDLVLADELQAGSYMYTVVSVPSSAGVSEKQTEEGMLTEVGMPKELQRELQTVGLEELQIQELWLYWRDDKPVYRTFTKYAVIAITTFSNRSSVAAAAVADKVWEIFQTTVDEDLKVPLSKLSLRDFGRTGEHVLLSGSAHSSSSNASLPPLIYQDKGVEVLNSPVKDDNFPTPADDTTTQILWPVDEWNAVAYDTGRKSESKLKALIANQTEEVLEVAKSVFIRPNKELCYPKIPDFVLVDKECKEVPTPENVGAILFALSTSETKSYCTSYAVGEAVSVGQVLLRNASLKRGFIIVGVTNVRKIRWFRVDRPSMTGQFIGTRSCEITSVRESLAGFMCCSLETLGIHKKSILVGQWQYFLGRWLGEGATSNVYAVNVDNAECAVKVAKAGYSISKDVRNLSKLKDIKGIPTIVMSDSQSNVIITPMAEQFTLELLCRKKMHMHLVELVDTLQCAHGRGIVNRDVRIANILIAEDQLIIVDWGFAAPLNEPDIYAGTTHFASDKVLKKLEEGQHTFCFDVSDDLVSLVRCLYVLLRLDYLRMQKFLQEIGNDEYAQILEFWETEIKDNSQWQDPERFAEQGDYAALKLWIQSWLKLCM